MTRENTELAGAIERLEWRRNARELGATREALDMAKGDDNRKAYVSRVLSSATCEVDYADLRTILSALSAAPLHEGEGEPDCTCPEPGARRERICRKCYPTPAAFLDVARMANAAPPPSVEKAGFGTLHPATADLVDRFAIAMKEKLEKAEAKYGYSDGWLSDDWQADLVRDLAHHVQKGDPRDVAAYCAFAWHHGWSTTPAHSVEVERLREALEKQADQMNFLSRMADGQRRCERGSGPATWKTTIAAIRSEALVGEAAARAALSRKQEPGVPTPGGEGE